MKFQKKVIALLLVLTLAFALCACGGLSDEEIAKNLEGKWVSSEVDFIEQFKQGLNSSGDKELADNIQLDSLKLKVCYTFKDGVATISVDEESLKAAEESLKAPLKAVFVKYFEDNLEAQMNMSMDQILKTTGCKDIDELFQKSMDQTLDDFIAQLAAQSLSGLKGDLGSGNYEVKGGTVTVTGANDTKDVFKYDGKADSFEINDPSFGKITMTRVK